MFRKSKLKGPVGRIYPITIISFYIIGIIEVIVRKHLFDIGYLEKFSGPFSYPGPIYSIIGVALFFVIMGIFQMIRYKLWVYPVMGLLIGYSTLQSLYAYDYLFFTLWSYLIGIFVVALFIVINWPALKAHELFESNTRRLLKLAVDTINETDAGYTARPYFTGKIQYDYEDIQGFARFMKSKYFAFPEYRSQGIYLLFSLGTAVIKEPEPGQVSYVLFNKNGSINVHISPFDYKQYRKRYSFDQLCDSLGTTIMRFLEYYEEGNETRIRSELRSV